MNLLSFLPLLTLGMVSEGEEDNNESVDTTDNKPASDDTTEDATEDTTTDNDEAGDSDSDEYEDVLDHLNKAQSFDQIDPKKLSKELQPLYRKMQGIFTRSHQGALAVRDKARAFDLLSDDPDFIQFLQDKKSQITGGAKKKQAPTSRRSNIDEDEEGDEENAPLTRADFLRFQKEMREEGIIKDKQNQYRQQREQFLKDNPVAKVYVQELAEMIREHPSLSFSQAWRLVVADNEDIREAVREHKKNASRSLKPTRNGGIGGEEPITTESKRKGVNSFKDAWNLAKRIHKSR